MDDTGIRPSEHLRKSMPHIKWDETPDPVPRKHWNTIVGLQDKELMGKILLDWQTDHLCPHAWDIFGKSIKPETKVMMGRVFEECRNHGWFRPQVINNELCFLSTYPISRVLETWHDRQVDRWAAGKQEDLDFVPEP